MRSGIPVAVLSVVLTLAGCTAMPTAGTGSTPPPDPAVSHAATRLFAGQLLAYAFGGLTPSEVTGVRAAVGGPVTPVYAGEVAVASGVADFPQIPVATMTADPVRYAQAVGRPALAKQLSSGLVLSETGARLRRVHVGGTIRLDSGRSLPVTAVVDDHELGGYEMATGPAVLGRQAATRVSYLLVAEKGSLTTSAALVRRALPGRKVRVKLDGDNGYMSSVDTVLTQAQMKTRFGEFAMRQDPGGGGYLTPDPTWEQKWIVSRRVVQLGLVTCNKAVLPDLTAAMQEITDRGLGSLVHTADFEYEGGCYNPRAVPFARGGTLSAHSWGAAVDINVDVNPLGAAPDQDARLVAIMGRHGFTWGGRWLRTDAAHFEWVGTAVPH